MYCCRTLNFPDHNIPVQQRVRYLLPVRTTKDSVGISATFIPPCRLDRNRRSPFNQSTGVSHRHTNYANDVRRETLCDSKTRKMVSENQIHVIGRHRGLGNQKCSSDQPAIWDGGVLADTAPYPTRPIGRPQHRS